MPKEHAAHAKIIQYDQYFKKLSDQNHSGTGVAKVGADQTPWLRRTRADPPN